MQAFAIWLTGLPGSGKSTIAAVLLAQLQARGLRPAWLESDALRRLVTPKPGYDEAERDLFYEAMVELGHCLADRGVPVIFDATANRRRYRVLGRERIARLCEVHVECPLPVCEARDPKGLYRRAREGKSDTLPGAQSAYEAPLSPELLVHSHDEPAVQAASRVVDFLVSRGWI